MPVCSVCNPPCPRCVNNFARNAMTKSNTFIFGKGLTVHTILDVHACIDHNMNARAVCTTGCSAKSMVYEDLPFGRGSVSRLAKFTERGIMGLPLRTPGVPYPIRVYMLPLLTITMAKRGGGVTNLPSDSPGDSVALQNLRQKAPRRDKFGLADIPMHVTGVTALAARYGVTYTLSVC